LTKWSADTCDCVIRFNDNIIWIESIKKCRHHNLLNGQNHLDTVLAQNRRFNSALGLILNETQIEIINIAKHVNKLRIRVEPRQNFDEHLPHEEPLSFFQNLRRILRL